MKKQDTLKTVNENKFKLWVPQAILYLFFAWWSYLVISKYYKNFPIILQNLEWIFSLRNYTVSITTGVIKVWMSHIVSIVILLIILYAALIIGNKLLQTFRLTDVPGIEKFIFSIGLGLGGLMLFVLLLGRCGLLYREIIWAILIILCALSAFNTVRKPLTPPSPSRGEDKKEGIPKAGSVLRTKKEKFSTTDMILLLVFLTAVLFNLLGALTPETFYDSLRYHLGIPVHWILNHKIITIPHEHESFFPLNIQILYTIGVILKDDVVAHLIHWSLGLLTCGAIFVFCKKYFSQRTGILAVVIFYTIPLVCAVSWKTAIELGITFFQFLAIFAVINSEQPSVSEVTDKTTAIKWAVLSGIFLGAALGSKYTCFIYGACLMFTLFIFMFFLRNRPDNLDNPADKSGRYSLFELKKIILIGFIGSIIFSPWALRNYIEKGSFLYPFAYSEKEGMVFRPGLKEFPATDQAPVQLNLKNLITIPWNLTMGKIGQEGFSGPVLLYLLPLTFMVIRTKRITKFLIVYSILNYALWIIVARVYLRHFLPVLSVVSIVLAIYLYEIQKNELFKKIVSLLIVFMALGNIYFALTILKSSHDPFGVVFGFQTKKEYLSTQRPSYPCPYYQTVSWANENLLKTAKILFLGETRGYYSQRKFVTATGAVFNPVVLWSTESKNAEELHRKLTEEEKITHILVNPPEGQRLAGYDNFCWEDGTGLKTFNEFWNKYVREIYRGIGDVTLRDGRQGSKVPEFWNQYVRNPWSYVYLYEILPIGKENKPGQAHYNFLMNKAWYNQERWEKIKNIAELQQ